MTPTLDDPTTSQDYQFDQPTDEPAQSSEPRLYGENNVELPLELQNALLSLLQEAQRQDLYQRRIEILRDRRNRFYERGIQHIYPDMTGAFIVGSPGALVPDPGNPNGGVQCANFINDYNIFGRSLQIIIAKLTENPVGVDFQPDSGDNAVDLQASEAAEAYRLLYDRRNDSKDLLTAIVRMMGLSGRTVAWTRTIADAQRWGYDESGQPRKMQTTTVYGTLESKVPILAQALCDCPYLIISEDPHIYMAKADYPDFADKISEESDSTTSDTQFERLARLGALQGAAAAYQLTDTYQYYVERKYIWFRPAMFLSKELDSSYVDQANPEIATLHDALQEAFPDGCCATFIGAQYVGSRNTVMDDELGIDFPYAGEGMARMAIMDPAVAIQDDFNDDMNNYHEVKVVGWPSTWINADTTDLGSINDQVAAPYCFRAMKQRPPRDTDMEKQFYREPDPNIPESFMRHTEYMATQLLQFILAIPSAVQGAGMPDQKTASGYNAALTQAMGQLGVIWGAVTRLVCKILRQAALAAARDNVDGKVLMVPSDKGAVPLDISNLQKGNFLAFPDKDSGFPESTTQVRASLMATLELALKDPEIASALLASPDNWDFIFRTLGISGLVIPEAVSRRKQLAEIETLLKQSPVMPDQPTLPASPTQPALPDPNNPEAQAMAAQPVSSVQVQQLDYHDWEYEECREFLSNYPKVQQQIAAGNEAGIENVRLHAMEHLQFIQQAAAQAQAQQMAMEQAKKPAPQQQPQQQAA